MRLANGKYFHTCTSWEEVSVWTARSDNWSVRSSQDSGRTVQIALRLFAQKAWVSLTQIASVWAAHSPCGLVTELGNMRAEWLQGRRLALTVHVLLYSCSRDTSLKFLSAAEVAGRRQDNSTAWAPRAILCVLPRDVTHRRRMLYKQHVHPPHFECDDYVITRGVSGIVHALVHGQGFGFGPC